MASAVAPKRVVPGKRTGVTVAADIKKNENGMEDLDSFFDAAKSPEKKETAVTDDDNNNSTTQQAVKNPKKRIRFSLDDNAEDGEAVGKDAAVRKMMQRGGRGSMSPSDLSSVATASPLPKESPPAPAPSVEETREASPEEEDEKEEETVAQTQQAEQRTPGAGIVKVTEKTPTPPADQEEEPLLTQDDDEDDDDDMVPPPPPDDSPEPQQEPSKTPDQRQYDADEANFPHADDDDDDNKEGTGFVMAQADTDYDEDDKEGDGFVMAQDDDEDDDDDDVVDPKTPITQEEPSTSTKKQKRKKKSSKEELDEVVDSEAETESDTPVVTKKKTLKKKKTSQKKRKTADDSSSDDSSDEDTPPPPKKQQKKKSKKAPHKFGHFTPKGIPSGPRQFTAIPVSDLKPDATQTGGLRRGKRIRVQPLEFWRNEGYVWGPNDEFNDEKYDSLINMPVPKAVNRADPTPYKPRKVTFKKQAEKGKSRKGKKNSGEEDDDGDDDEPVKQKPFDTRKLHKKYKYVNGEEVYLWDDCIHEATDLKVISYKAGLVARDLPRAKSRPKSESRVVGKAAQAFNVLNDQNPAYPGYLMGNLLLPPKGIKDSESVGSCAQTFTVVTCQNLAVEIAYGNPDQNDGDVKPDTAQRVLLSMGDMFRIPPGNCYRLENHSRDVECYLTWTIIRPNAGVDEEEE